MENTRLYEYTGGCEEADYSKEVTVPLEERMFTDGSKWVSDDERIAYIEQRDATQGFDVYHFPNAYLYGDIIPDRCLFQSSPYLKIVISIAKKAIETYNLGLNEVYLFSKVVMSNYKRQSYRTLFYITFEVYRPIHHTELRLEFDRSCYSETFHALGRHGINGAIKVLFCRPKYVLGVEGFDSIQQNFTPSNDVTTLCVEYFNKTRNTNCQFVKVINTNKNYRYGDGLEELFMTFEVVHEKAGFQTLQAIVILGNIEPYVRMCRVKPTEPMHTDALFPTKYNLNLPFDKYIDSD